MQPLVSVVVPTYNRQASLQRLLEALARQTVPAAQLELLVVDDGSSDGTREWLGRQSPDFALRVLEQSHSGPAAARNLGVRHASGEVILFLDDDVLPGPELVRRHLAVRAAEGDVVVIGPMLPPPDWARPVWVRWEEAQLLKQYRDMIAGRYACTARQFYTGNASLSRRRFLDTGGFDPRYRRAEDVELAYRLDQQGARFVFDPQAAVLHYAWRSFQAWSRTPRQYGAYDVMMDREEGHGALRDALTEFHTRHPLNRALARLLVGHNALIAGVVTGLGWVARAADRQAGAGLAAAALSAAFNLLYWQGLSDELGGAGRVWAAGSSA